MLRILAIGTVLAAIVVAWLVLGRQRPEKSSSAGAEAASDNSEAAGQEVNGAANPKAGAGTATLPKPLRMSATNPNAGGDQAASDDQLSIAEAFEREKKVPDSQSERSSMVRSVVDALASDEEGAAKIRKLECRVRHCLITIGGEDQKSVATLVNALQDERGFLGKAEGLMMSRDGDDISLYLRFAE